MLYGRDEELATIDRLLGEVREGRGRTLVLRGEAGIGKTALLDHAAAEASGMRVLHGTGVEYESGMPYAGLHMLLSGHLDRIDALPDAQARALRNALNMGARQDADGGDRFLVGLAVLTLLADLAEEKPLLCLVDDAHWLDGPSAEALLFAARRLEAEPVGLLFAARDMDAPEFPAPGLPEMRLRGLDRAAATELLARHAAELPRHVHHEILAAATGNPLALLELPGLRTQAHDASSAYERIRRSYAGKIAALPEASRTLLLLVAADDAGGIGAIMGAAERLGASVDDLEPAERRGLLRSTADGRLEVRHPIVRTAAYGDAPLNLRIAAHRALAETYRERGDRCHHAWHLARSATGPDEAVAAVLESTAGAERDSGGNASAAAMYESAAALSQIGRAHV